MLKILTNASCKEFYGEVKEQQLNFNEKKEIYTFIENTIKKDWENLDITYINTYKHHIILKKMEDGVILYIYNWVKWGRYL